VKTSDLRLMSDAELTSELERIRRELLNLRCRIALGEEVKGSDVSKCRRDIARILTVQRERQASSEAVAVPPAESE
jgi:large subunit ribosomal protein L29